MVEQTPTGEAGHFKRRALLTGVGAAAAAGLAAKAWRDQDENAFRTEVFIGSVPSYRGDLERVIRAGLDELRVHPARIRGKSVLLKPNLVEPSLESPQINTHPRLVQAAIEVFRSLGAREVFVAEGQGHSRDTDFVLEQSGLGQALKESRAEFVDLNHDELYRSKNSFRATSMPQLVLPASLRRADLIVSMPKLKTHHWAGITVSMKNLFGVMPGVFYGWPKNVLHHEGIEQSILDINATVRPHLAIVDGIVGMEGDGPIMGTPRQLGAIVIGTNFPSVDATCARMMKINPWRVGYLAAASGRLGAISERHITQRGEAIDQLALPFQLLDHPNFARLRT